ncbi:DgyrCDS3438 [Dimorphilus gyrociliatus]|uniref:DgyrCDS3438 n=1 Tax=Dimorphilus gyrociliatus TaxID=2664684 RepID=A0A7I8VG88_9ANNE|nr:DgyrCDS3438 [Dimorphilus gyrociliatus]
MQEENIGSLAGDVQNWATLIQNYILQLAEEGIRRKYTQSLFDTANYTFDEKDGAILVQNVKETLGDYFSMKTQAAQRLADKAVEAYDKWLLDENKVTYDNLHKMPRDIYRDSDIPSTLDKGKYSVFKSKFRQVIFLNYSTVKISDDVPRKDPNTIKTVNWTRALEDVMIDNAKKDPQLRWQYFGSTAGLVRLYPGREWDTNFAGFYNDYDPRLRPWYIGATSGPKDVVIILDCSLSMKGEKFSIAQAVAKTVINTLTRQDYINVICARASHWDEVGKWHEFGSQVLSCRKDSLVQATTAHRKDLIEKIYRLEPGGTSEVEKGFEKAFKLLAGSIRTGCQSVIVFATDGRDTDGEQVRCGPGYYTRSGYVAGPICKYNWTKVWQVTNEKNKLLDPPARIFSYLTKDEGELFPGKLACAHGGSLTKLANGENLINQMHSYFDFLFRNAKSTMGLWTSPYIDAWKLGLMVTYSIPCLVDDPIFIPIEQLEQTQGEPRNFSRVVEEMKAGKTGQLTIKNARRGIGGKTFMDATYYYAALNDSEYAFAFSMADTDKTFRRAQTPVDLDNYDKSYFNLLIEYNSSTAKEAFPGTYDYLDVRDNEQKKYPGLRVSYLHSSIFLAPKCHCDPTAYFYDEDLAQKTVEAHKYINSMTDDFGCTNQKSKYERGVRADVLITQPVERLWRVRNFDGIDTVKWTYVGMRSGVFRTYPGHRSRRLYDPSQRPWFKRASSTPSKTSISTAYMDAAGVGKIITISQAVFEGMLVREDTSECVKSKKKEELLPGGCPCETDTDCLSGFCYISEAPGINRDKPRCATERVEAVTSLDILYEKFHKITFEKMKASDKKKSCNQTYPCSHNKKQLCKTRCYLFDNAAYLITDREFVKASPLDTSKYKDVTLGRKEGEVMKELIYKHSFFMRQEKIDFQGKCRISPYAPKVTLSGIPQNPEEQDNYYQKKGPIPKFSNEFGCITDVVAYAVNASALGSSGMIVGNVSGPSLSIQERTESLMGHALIKIQQKQP